MAITWIFTAMLIANCVMESVNALSRINVESDYVPPPSDIIGSRDPNEHYQEYWHKNNLKDLQRLLQNDERNTNIAKNVIFFLGDGMSLSTITASRIFEAQRRNHNGERNFLSWEKFPHTGLAKTYCVDKTVSDSACTATAFWSGVKSNYATIGVTAHVKLKDCKAVNETTSVKTLMYYAQKAGKATGVVTNTRITDASPAGGYAHSSTRKYESDAKVINDNQDPAVCIDIATQLIKNRPGIDANVIFGGGTVNFLPKNVKDKYGNQGVRLDGVNLVEEWVNDKNTRFGEDHVKMIWDVKELHQVNYSETSHILGLFSPDDMAYNYEADRNIEPTLSEMTEAAIKVLKNNENGFLLFVEGGEIDLAHHAVRAKEALDETVELHKAVNVALSLTSPEDTLIVVSADHAHTLTMSGYPTRGENILKFGGKSDMDDMLYTVLSYANGKSAGRFEIHDEDLDQPDSEYPSGVPMENETHSGEDVIVYSLGPWSHIFSGVYEQTMIPTILMFASCIGPNNVNACNYKDARLRTEISVR